MYYSLWELRGVHCGPVRRCLWCDHLWIWQPQRDENEPALSFLPWYELGSTPGLPLRIEECLDALLPLQWRLRELAFLGSKLVKSRYADWPKQLLWLCEFRGCSEKSFQCLYMELKKKRLRLLKLQWKSSPAYLSRLNWNKIWKNSVHQEIPGVWKWPEAFKPLQWKLQKLVFWWSKLDDVSFFRKEEDRRLKEKWGSWNRSWIDEKIGDENSFCGSVEGVGQVLTLFMPFDLQS